MQITTIGAEEAIILAVALIGLFFWHMVIEAKLFFWGVANDKKFKIDWMARGWHTLMYIIQNPFKKDKEFASLVLQGRISLLLMVGLALVAFILSGSFS